MAAKRKVVTHQADPRDFKAELAAALLHSEKTWDKVRTASDFLAKREKELEREKEPYQRDVNSATKDHDEARIAHERLRRERFAALLVLHPELIDVLVPRHRYTDKSRTGCREDCARCRLESDWLYDPEPLEITVSFKGWDE